MAHNIQELRYSLNLVQAVGKFCAVGHIQDLMLARLPRPELLHGIVFVSLQELGHRGWGSREEGRSGGAATPAVLVFWLPLCKNLDLLLAVRPKYHLCTPKLRNTP